ncbi:hypothetical protein EON64_05075 [archaeon]|nr:MAG: hypothetical protein EON64_05075 [archaeon]
MLYQGTILMSILNWAGLVINGLVAFMLPMILALKAIELRTRSPHRVTLTVQAQPSVLHREENAHFQPSNPSHHHHTSSPNGKHTDGHSSVSVGVHDVHHADVNADVEMRRLPASIQPSTLHAPASPTHSDKHAHTHADAQEEDSMHLSWSDRSLLISLSTSNHLDRPLHSLMGLHSVENSERTIATVSSADTLDILHHGTVRRLKTNTIVQPLPEYLEAYRREIVIFMIASFAVIILTTIMEDAINGILIPE